MISIATLKKITLIILPFLMITVALNAQIINTVIGNGNNGFAGDGGLATAATLNQPVAICIDVNGNIYFSDYSNQRIRKVTTSGIITTVAGNGNAGYSGDGGPATAASINKPIGITVDAAGNLFIADSYNDRIRKVNTSGIITTVAGIGSPGFTGDGGAATAAKLYEPTGVCVDDMGNIFIADNNNNRIRKVNTSGIISTVAGNGTAGFAGDGGSATSAQLHYPFEVFAGANNSLFIADYSNNRIRKIDASGIITTVAGNGTGGFAGDGALATNAEIYLPQGVTTDAAGNIYIADFFNHRIRKVDNAGIIHTLAGTNTGGYNGDGILATTAQLYYPTGVRTDAAGNVYIADSFNDRIRKIATVTGIAEATNNTAMAVFPNPANEQFIITNEAFLNQKFDIELYDVFGHLLFKKAENIATVTVDTKDFTAGFYELKVLSANGVAHFFKVQIVH